MEQIFTYFSFSFVFTQNNLLIIDVPILIQSIHTRKIERFVFRFTCPRETFSNLIFSNLIFLIKIIFRKALERKKKGEENVYRVKSRKKTFIVFLSENFCRIEWNSDRLGSDSRVWRHITNSTGSHGSDSLERRVSRL